MSASALFALSRQDAEAFLAKVVSSLDDITLKNAIYGIASSYRPFMLDELVVVKAPMNSIRSATHKNIERMMRDEGLSHEEAWLELRCRELEDGHSICCSEECDGHSSAMTVLVEAAYRGEEKRRSRQANRCYSHEPYVLEKTFFVVDEPFVVDEKPFVVDEPYVAPPRVRDAEDHWPFMRCKNVAKALQVYGSKPLPRSHHALLEHLARLSNVSLETFKKTSPHVLFKNDNRVLNVIGKNSSW